MQLRSSDVYHSVSAAKILALVRRAIAARTFSSVGKIVYSRFGREKSRVSAIRFALRISHATNGRRCHWPRMIYAG